MEVELAERLATTQDLQSTLIAYIKEHFGEMLGEHAALLDAPGGLDALAGLLERGQLGRR